jgi:hypothetical protein
MMMKMSGNKEKLKKNKHGHVSVRDGRVSYVKMRMSHDTICDFESCEEPDKYLVCYGSSCRLSSIVKIVCEEHLEWGLDCAEVRYEEIEKRWAKKP